MGADATLLFVLMATASICFGAWDLWREKARDVLIAVGAAEVALLGGAALEALIPGGLVIGAVVASLVAVKGVGRVRAAREEELKRLLAEVPDAGSRLLELYDRLDAQEMAESSSQEIGRVLVSGLLAMMGIFLMAAGVTGDTWQFVLAGAGLIFLPASQMARAAVIEKERWDITAEMAPSDSAAGLLVSEGSEERGAEGEVTHGRTDSHG